MNEKFTDNLILQLKQQSIFSPEDIKNFQNKITDAFVKESILHGLKIIIYVWNTFIICWKI